MSPSRMTFMSERHVRATKERLRDVSEVRISCRALGRSHVMLFRLHDGPAGCAVFWSLGFAETLTFSLEDHPDPDVVLTGDWATMIGTTRAARGTQRVARPPLDQRSGGLRSA